MPDNDDLSRRSVPAAAGAFLAERYPELAGQKLVGLRLGSSWLVETEPTTPSEGSQPYKVVLMVNRHGFVEELGPVTLRQTVHRCLAGLQSPAV